MSSTLRKLLILGVFLASPVNAFAFDFDKELEKQNDKYDSISICVDKKECSTGVANDSRGKSLKVTLISRKR